jgi:hypothetical protein
VKATNLLGDGPSSAPSNAVTPSPVDLTPPVVKLVTKPAVVSKSTTADFTYAGDDFGRTATTLTYLCSLDAALIPCPVAPHYTGLSQGAHVFQIKATDAALNTGPLTTYSWSVDTVAPTVTAAAQSLWTLGTAMTLHYTGADGGSGIASHKVTYRRAAYNGAFPSVWSVAPVGSSTASTITVARGYTYCMAVRFTDKAGNYKDSLTRCTATPLDDGALARSPGWTYSGGHAGYYGGTYTVAKRSLASLTRTGMQTRRISVMALTCASCGSLRVYWNGVLIKTLSLYSSTTKHQILAVKDFGSVKVGTLVLRTASSKAAYVDGLGASRV